jgi:hypothetical protein
MSYRRSISTIGRVSITIGGVSNTIVGVVSITIVITTLREFFIGSRIRPCESFLYVR